MLTVKKSKDRKTITLELDQEHIKALKAKIDRVGNRFEWDTEMKQLLFYHTRPKTRCRFIEPYMIGALTSDPYLLSDNAQVKWLNPRTRNKEDLPLIDLGHEYKILNPDTVRIYLWESGHYTSNFLLKNLLSEPQTFRLLE